MANKEDKILAIICVVLLIVSIGFFSYVKSTEEEVEMVSEVLSATRDYTDAGVSRYINASTLYNQITDDDSTNDPYIVSIRGDEYYAKGHIPGAVSIPRTSMFTEEYLNKLPKDQRIVVYCYTGHTASQATALLNVMGYDAVSLLWGMCSWTNDSDVAKNAYFTGGSDYDFVSGSEPGNLGGVVGNIILPRIIPLNPLGCGGDTEPPEDTTPIVISDGSDALREASYAATLKSPAISASGLWELIYNDTDSTNDPFILDVRKSDAYESGHISSAINIGLADLFKDENMAKLPDDMDRQIVVVCYTGHTASQATALLNINGYNAIALKFGMCSWTTDTDVTQGKCFDKTKHCLDYPFDTGIWDDEVREKVYDSLNPLKTIAITAESLYNNLWDGDTSNDPFVLSIRKSADYELGHIPGAVNYGGISALYADENLAMLPYDNQIVVVCYTGHTASQAAALLNLLGYNATALKWGMVGWCANTTIAPKGFERTSPNYPICTGIEPGTIDEAEEATI